jgi:phosphoribosyl 1,2-cyclic phosphodiesterase
MRIVSLASGSSGNAILVDDGATRVIVDCGIGPRTLATRLKAAQVRPDEVSAILVTHEHIDHIKGIAQAVTKWRWALHGSAGTIRGLSPTIRHKATLIGERTRIGTLDVEMIRTSHDANEPTAYAIGSRASGMRAGIAHDLGEPSDRLVRAFHGVDLLCIEANHCRVMLRDGPYPAYLKARVAGEMGHLSNDQSAAFIDAVSTADLRAVLLLHLSAVNNAPPVAVSATRRAVTMRARKATLAAAVRSDVSPAIGIEPQVQLRLAI